MLSFWSKVVLRLNNFKSDVYNFNNFDFGSTDGLLLIGIITCLVISLVVVSYVMRSGHPEIFHLHGPTSPLLLKTAMVGIHNPFQIEIHHSDETSILLLRSYQTPCRELLLWGVEINALHKSLLDNHWRSFLRRLTDNAPFHELAQEAKNVENVGVGLNQSLCLEARLNEEFHSRVRTHYPLVMVVGVDDLDFPDFVPNCGSPNVVAMMTVFKVAHAMTPLRLRACSSFVVTNANQKFCLRPYIPSGMPAVDLEGPVDSQLPRTRQNCAVCLMLPLEVVTLPCRHAAVCSRCFKRLVDARCPICRSVIQYHFSLHS